LLCLFHSEGNAPKLLAATAIPLAEHGGDRKSEEVQVYGVPLIAQRGSSAQCLTAPPYGLGRSPQDLATIIEEHRNPAVLAEKVIPLHGHGTNQHSKEGGVDGVNSSTQGGNNKEYRTAKLARDAPEIVERMKTGEEPMTDEQERLYFGWKQYVRKYRRM